MKNNQWWSMFNTRKRPMWMGVFGKRKRSRGPMVMSVLGVMATMVSAAFYGIARGRQDEDTNQNEPMSKYAGKIQEYMKRADSRPTGAAFAEFADEIMPEAKEKQEEEK
ncbi:hypothetical protein IMZ31_10900 [Pontibacillus sp. ALD_SL1]|uniref:hypothetical protein n=1 Tax=Pontibacillus sp. ALD_SL1 TaxID=2777185 RepID=UPI001A95D72C|nr:hypothetical protein [Pontibacillus sp. ALD_SL1]QSS98619.1 hypothetical protein IMZ31_10900 [Pontibacillus sp. ALD_SL1]